MNILVVGNGFDIAHGLPTRYSDFLDFIQILNGCLKDKLYNQEDFYERVIEYKNQDIPEMIELNDCVYGNVWINYFLEIYQDLIKQEKGNWIDFEREMSLIVQILDEMNCKFKEFKREYVTYEDIDNFFSSKQIEKMNMFLKLVDSNYSLYSIRLDNLVLIKKIMIENLKKLDRVLEIYLSSFIKNSYVLKKKSLINNLHIDHLLSFNYTSTFLDLYGNVESDFIHGKADINNNKNNCPLILGIDEYLNEHDKNENIEFIYFKKYFQRILKGSGCTYKKWVNSVIKFSPDIHGYRNNLYFYGHSLDITDKDIIRDLIDTNFFKITIFYLNSSDLERKISNLVIDLGQDKLIEMASEPNPQIEFKLIEKESE